MKNFCFRCIEKISFFAARFFFCVSSNHEKTIKTKYFKKNLLFFGFYNYLSNFNLKNFDKMVKRISKNKVNNLTKWLMYTIYVRWDSVRSVYGCKQLSWWKISGARVSAVAALLMLLYSLNSSVESPAPIRLVG